MTVIIINEKKALMRGDFFVMCYHPNRWRVIPLLLFPLPALFVLGIAVRPDLTVLYSLSFALILTGLLAVCWVILFAGSLASSGQILRKTSTLTISSTGYSFKYWRPEYTVKWSKCIGLMCTATDILIFHKSTGAGLSVPLSAFADPREAQRFYETAVAYWQSAKTGQPFMPADETHIWPPAPRPSNSAEPGDTPSC